MLTISRRLTLLLSLTLLLLTVLACDNTSAPSESSATASPPPPASPAKAPVNEAATEADTEADTRENALPTVAFLGDSLTAGLGLAEEEAFPAVLGKLLAAEETPVRVVNAGVSGDTSAAGLRRLDWLLRQEPDVLIVGLGANDALRAQDVAATEENLQQIVREAKNAGAEVLLLGMKVPPNYGPDFAAAFGAIYPRLAETENVALVPFMLEGVGGIAELNQADGIHPNASGQRRIAELILPHLRPFIAEIQATPERKRETSQAPASGEL